MAETMMFKPLGVVEEPSAPNQPEGALRAAVNVSLREAGIIQPRPRVDYESTEKVSLPGAFSASSCQDLVPYQGVLFACVGASSQLPSGVTAAGTPQLWARTDATTGTVYSYTPPSTGVPVDDSDGNHQNPVWAKARDNLYIGQFTGTRKIVGASDSTIWDAGAPSCGISQITASGSPTPWLPNTEYVGYRATVIREDANGLIVESVPSAPVVVQNTLGVSSGVSMYVVMNPNLMLPGDKIRLYRTSNSASSAIGDEYRFVAEIDMTLSAVLYADDIAYGSLGGVLYTSPSQQGATGANYRPPSCAAMASHRGSLFFGNVREPSRLLLSTQAAVVSSGSTTGVGTRAITGDTTLGSNQITNVTTSMLGLEVGMVIVPTFGGVHFTNSNLVITGLGPTTITVNENAILTSPVGGFQGTAYDVLLLTDTASGTVERWARIPESYGGGVGIMSINGIFDAAGSRTASKFWETLEYTPDPGYSEGVTIELWDRNISGFTVNATHGSEYSPPLPNVISAGYDVSPKSARGTVWWSKADQPEHVPLENFVRVGSDSEDILALAPTRDRMYVFKTDGIWAVHGESADSGWRFDPVDLDSRCVSPRSVKVVGESVLFLSDRGVERLTGSTVQLLSGPVQRSMRQIASFVTELNATYPWQYVGGAHYDQNTGDYLVDSPFGVGDSNRLLTYYVTDPAVDRFWGCWNVYNTNTGQWCTWDPFVSMSGAFPRFSRYDVVGSTMFEGRFLIGIRPSASADEAAIVLKYDEWAADRWPGTGTGYTVTQVSTGAYGTEATLSFAGSIPILSALNVSGTLRMMTFPQENSITLPVLATGDGVILEDTVNNGSYELATPIVSHIWPAYQFAGEPTEIKHFQEVTACFETSDRNVLQWRFFAGPEDNYDLYLMSGQAFNTSLLDGLTVRSAALTNSEPVDVLFPGQSGVESRAYVPSEVARSTRLNFLASMPSSHGGWRLYGFLLKHRYSGKRSPFAYQKGIY